MQPNYIYSHEYRFFKYETLKELYTHGSTKDHKYRKLSTDIIRRYVKVVNILKSVRRIEDLCLIKSLHYEKKHGDLNGVDVVWITPQYRLFFYSSPDGSGMQAFCLNECCHCS